MVGFKLIAFWDTFRVPKYNTFEPNHPLILGIT